jgi:hypothetical protein
LGFAFAARVVAPLASGSENGLPSYSNPTATTILGCYL